MNESTQESKIWEYGVVSVGTHFERRLFDLDDNANAPELQAP